MKITGEAIHVDPTAVAEDGTKLEPEERTAIETIATPVETKLGTANDQGVNVGQMRGTISRASDVIDVARDVSTQCALCQFWRRDDYLKHLDAIAHTRDGQAQIEKFRGMLLGLRSKPETDDDVESDVISVADAPIDENDLIAVNISIRNHFAICAAFTESTGIVSVTPFDGGCPADDARFKARDRATKVEASSRYDTILRLAQGRTE